MLIHIEAIQMTTRSQFRRQNNRELVDCTCAVLSPKRIGHAVRSLGAWSASELAERGQIALGDVGYICGVKAISLIEFYIDSNA
jgi:hypothetical protein